MADSAVTIKRPLSMNFRMTISGEDKSTILNDYICMEPWIALVLYDYYMLKYNKNIYVGIAGDYFPYSNNLFLNKNEIDIETFVDCLLNFKDVYDDYNSLHDSGVTAFKTDDRFVQIFANSRSVDVLANNSSIINYAADNILSVTDNVTSSLFTKDSGAREIDSSQILKYVYLKAVTAYSFGGPDRIFNYMRYILSIMPKENFKGVMEAFLDACKKYRGLRTKALYYVPIETPFKSSFNVDSTNVISSEDYEYYEDSIKELLTDFK